MFWIKVLRIILFIWCLPQNIVGWIYTRNKKFHKFLFAPDNGYKNYTKNKRIKLIRWLRTKVLPNTYYYKEPGIFGSFGVSLGFFICIVCESQNGYSVETIQHENGHRIQSILLGPLYLVFVGLCSLIHFIYHKLIVIKKYDPVVANSKYHEFFTESWADRLGSC